MSCLRLNGRILTIVSFENRQVYMVKILTNQQYHHHLAPHHFSFQVSVRLSLSTASPELWLHSEQDQMQGLLFCMQPLQPAHAHVCCGSSHSVQRTCLFSASDKAAEPCACMHVADVAFEMSMNDNLLTGTVPAELQYLPLRVSTACSHSLSLWVFELVLLHAQCILCSLTTSQCLSQL